MPTQTVLDLIGNTPVIPARHLNTGQCQLFFKLENQNPGGSIKDRIALTMITAAETDGILKPGGTIVEATAGNTGLGLAVVASQKGYKLILVIPDKMSQEKILHLKALGAEIIMTRSDVGKGHPEYYQDIAARIAVEREAFFVNQFENPNNPRAHRETTGPEIWEQLEGRVDALVVGVGSGGMLSGIGGYLREKNPKLDIVLADPVGSILAPFINTGVMPDEVGSWIVEGIGEDFIPKNCDLSLVTHAYSISDRESITTARNVLAREGVICGPSSGTLISAALRYCRAQTEPKRVITFVCDSGNKYLSKMYNEHWLDDNGFIDRPVTHSLRDVIARPYHKGSAITVAPGDTLAAAYRKMRMYDVSQLPVMVKEQVQGIINETDILIAITGNPDGFQIKVAQAMAKTLHTVDAKTAPEELLHHFEGGYTVIVTDGDAFLGLITPVDLLTFLRKRVG